MPLKRVIEKVEDAEEVYRPLYKKGEGGKFYIEDIEGLVPSEKLAEFRDNNIALKSELEKFEGVDPTKYEELVKIETQLKEHKLFEAGKVDEIVAERTQGLLKEHKKELETRDTTIGSMNNRLSGLLIDSAVKSSAIAIGALPTAVDDVVLRAKSVFQINKDGQPVALDSQGKVKYGKSPTEPLSIDEWVKDLKQGAPHLFQGMQGSGARGSQGGPGNSGDTSKMSAAQKISQGLTQGHGTAQGA